MSLRASRAPVGAVVVLACAAGLTTLAPAASAGTRPVLAPRVALTPVGHPRAGDTATVHLRATLPRGDRVTSYSLNYGDHSRVASGRSMPTAGSHVYGKAGRYPVVLTITDARRHRTTAKFTITIAAAPVRVTAPLPTAPALPAPTPTAVAPVPPTPPVSSTPSPSPTSVSSGPRPQLSLASSDSTLLHLDSPRLVFGTSRDEGAAAAKSLTVQNTGAATLHVTNLRIVGTDATSFALAAGQPTSFDVDPGSSASVSVVFTPTAPTNCPDASNSSAIGDVVRVATLAIDSDDPTTTTGTADLAGVDACGEQGPNEPVLDQILQALGYTTNVDVQGGSRRYLGPSRYRAGTDEITSPTFVRADTSQPSRLVPLARYGTGLVTTGTYGAVGWYTPGQATYACASGCHRVYGFPGDPSATQYAEQQKLLPQPQPGAVTTFSPQGAFGLFWGDGRSTVFSDDGLNLARDANYKALSPSLYVHSLRVFPAYGPDHQLIPNTYLISGDATAQPILKNNDGQDIVLLLTNAQPAIATSAEPGSASLNQSAAPVASSTSSTCGPGGSSGQGAAGVSLSCATDSFDASRAAFTVRTRLTGGLTNGQEVDTWFGPDGADALTASLAQSPTGQRQLTVTMTVSGIATTVATVSVPNPGTGHVVDVLVHGNTQVPNPTPASQDPNGIRGYPVDELTVAYSIDGAAEVPVTSSPVSPADVMAWFSTSAQTGLAFSTPSVGGGSAAGTGSAVPELDVLVG